MSVGNEILRSLVKDCFTQAQFMITTYNVLFDGREDDTLLDVLSLDLKEQHALDVGVEQQRAVLDQITASTLRSGLQEMERLYQLTQALDLGESQDPDYLAILPMLDEQHKVFDTFVTKVPTGRQLAAPLMPSFGYCLTEWPNLCLAAARLVAQHVLSELGETNEHSGVEGAEG